MITFFTNNIFLPIELRGFKRVVIARRTSYCADRILALRLSSGPTAWKFLSLMTEKSSSPELSWTFLGSVGRSGCCCSLGDCLESSSFLANFSGGNLDEAGKRIQDWVENRRYIRCAHGILSLTCFPAHGIMLLHVGVRTRGGGGGGGTHVYWWYGDVPL